MSPSLSDSGFPQRRRVLAASLVGTAVEFYDFYVYATAASLVFGQLFFPRSSSSAQLLAAYGSFGLAFVARPLGAAFFGHRGDRVGRKATLVASLLLMGASTVLIGLLPTYGAFDARLAWLAPLALCILRFGQGFGLGGEWGGAALLAVENAPTGFRARYGMVPQLGAPVGFILANGFFLVLGTVLTPQAFAAWGWRLPFLMSALLVGVGLWVRLKLSETPAFAAALARRETVAVPIRDVLRDHLRETLAGTFAVVVCFALFYLATAFALGWATGTLGIDRRAMLAVLLVAIIFLAAGIAAAGTWSDKTSPRRVLIAGALATLAVAALLPVLLAAGTLPAIGTWLALALFTMGFVYGPLGAWLPSLFPAHLRYTGASLAFNVGGILGGGIAPLLAQTLADHGGLPWVGAYLGGAALVSLLALAVPVRASRALA